MAAARVQDRRWLFLKRRLLREIRRALSAEDMGRRRKQQAVAAEQPLRNP